MVALAGTGIVVAGGALALYRRARGASYIVQAAGVAALGVAGVLSLLGAPTAGANFSNGAGVTFGLDALTGFFLVVLAAGAVPALVYASASMDGVPHGASLSALSAAFVLSLAGVLTARSALTFLLFWELMTLLPAAAILVTRQERSARTAVFQYLAITHLGGAGVWVSLLLLAGIGGIGDPAATLAAGAPLQALIAIAAVVGFGTKAGVMPFHSWLPRAHPLAPGHFSALMSGVMVKVAIYGLVRVVFQWLGADPLWLGILLLALGALSALGGVTYALFQHDLKRLLAFHTIENVGIILLGLGAALLFEARGQPGWAALALAAALFHTLNHALFKGLLFLAAGSFARRVHGLELDRLGGLLRRMPWTGGGFLLGAMAIAGLPPLNGFVSEWLTLQALVHLAASSGASASGLGLVAIVAGALATLALAATAALAVFCFVKVVGLTLLGRARTPACAAAREVPAAMVASTSLLAGLCIVLGIAPGLLVPRLLTLAAEVEGTTASPAISGAVQGWGHFWGSGIAALGTGGLPALGIAAVLALFVTVLLAARGRPRTAAAPVWACGQRLTPALWWTSAGFTKPLRLSLETLLRPHRTVKLSSENGVPQRLTYDGHVPHLFDTKVYRPIVRWALSNAARARRLQSGSVRTYMVYLLALVLVLLAAVKVGLLG
jgi:hydrogenase-4 component B